MVNISTHVREDCHVLVLMRESIIDVILKAAVERDGLNVFFRNNSEIEIIFSLYSLRFFILFR